MSRLWGFRGLLWSGLAPKFLSQPPKLEDGAAPQTSASTPLVTKWNKQAATAAEICVLLLTGDWKGPVERS